MRSRQVARSGHSSNVLFRFFSVRSEKQAFLRAVEKNVTMIRFIVNEIELVVNNLLVLYSLVFNVTLNLPLMSFLKI